MVTIFQQVLSCSITSSKLVNKTICRFLRLVGAIESRLTKEILYVQLNTFQKIKRLHIGCGRYIASDWLNIDDYSTAVAPYGVITYSNGTVTLNIDFHKLDFAIFNNIKYIYSSHFIEHITYNQCRNFLIDAYRCMDTGGVIRLSCPDMGLWIKNYYENNKLFFQKYRYRGTKNPKIRTNGDIFMSQCHGHKHKWNYDFESLKLMMEDSGFKNVVKKTHFDSLIPNIKDVEPLDEIRQMESLYIEGCK